MLVRGYELRRGDSFPSQKELLGGVVDRILDDSIEEGVKYARDALASYKPPLKDLVITKSCRAFNEYKRPDSMTNVRCARMLMERGEVFYPNTKVSWIVTDGSISPLGIEPWTEDETAAITPDYQYYRKRIALTLSRITSTFGWSEEELLSGGRNSKLSDFFALE